MKKISPRNFDFYPYLSLSCDRYHRLSKIARYLKLLEFFYNRNCQDFSQCLKILESELKINLQNYITNIVNHRPAYRITCISNRRILSEISSILVPFLYREYGITNILPLKSVSENFSQNLFYDIIKIFFFSTPTELRLHPQPTTLVKIIL